LGDNGEIVGTVGARHTQCIRCDGGEPHVAIVQNGPYASFCRSCRRKQYYADNKERENRLCRENYHNNNGRVKMLERWYSGNYHKRLKKDGGKCVFCGDHNDLTIHHKDKTGKKSVGTYKKSNNKLDNLVTLCRSCHTKLHMGSLSLSSL